MIIFRGVNPYFQTIVIFKRKGLPHKREASNTSTLRDNDLLRKMICVFLDFFFWWLEKIAHILPNGWNIGWNILPNGGLMVIYHDRK